MYRSTNRPSVAEPEVWFRIVHVTLDNVHDSVAYREQTVEIALGPKGAFENGNIGRLTRRVPTSQVVCAVPERSRRVKPPTPPKQPKTPRVVETLRKALEWHRQLEVGETESQSDIARREGISRARVTQVLMLLRLAPEIQERVLTLSPTYERPVISEHVLRPIAMYSNMHQQLQAFAEVESR